MVRLNMMMIVHMKVTGYHGYDDHDADGHDSDNDDDDDDDNDGQDQDQDQDQAGVGVGYYLSKSQWDMLDADFSDIATCRFFSSHAQRMHIPPPSSLREAKLQCSC